MKSIKKFKYKFDIQAFGEKNNGEIIVDATQRPLSVREIIDRFASGIPIEQYVQSVDYDDTDRMPEYHVDNADLAGFVASTNRRIVEATEEANNERAERSEASEERATSRSDNESQTGAEAPEPPQQ